MVPFSYISSVMFRLIFSALLAALFLSSCDKILKIVKTDSSGSIKDDIQINSPSKPEIVAAFEAISKATHEHNKMLIQNIDAGKAANELAFSAGISSLTSSARVHDGLAKKIIEAMTSTCLNEKDLFTPFDTIERQFQGMQTWSRDQSVQTRGYIQIIDRMIATYDGAVSYLQRGEEPMHERNFERYGVPAEVSAEFLRLRRLYGKEVGESKLGMFREQRDALQCYRDSMTTADRVKAGELIAQGQKHEAKSKEFESKMAEEIRKQVNATKSLL
jgi:hypothetical protein